MISLRRLTLLALSFFVITSGNIKDLEKELLNTETFSLEKATQIVENLSLGAINLPLYGERPILHHIMNMFILSKNFEKRASLVKLAHLVLERGANVSLSLRRDPPVLLKSIVSTYYRSYCTHS